MKIFVGNLSYETTPEELAQAFSAYGSGEGGNIIRDRDTGKSRGFGFVEMMDPQEAQHAMDGLNGAKFHGRALQVNEARPRADGFGGDGGRRSRRSSSW